MTVRVGELREAKVSGRDVVVEVEAVLSTYRIGRKDFREDQVCLVKSLSTGRRLQARTPDQLGRRLEV